MGLGNKDITIAIAIVLGFIALIQAMAGNWVGAFLGVVILGCVLYSEFVRPARTRR